MMLPLEYLREVGVVPPPSRGVLISTAIRDVTERRRMEAAAGHLASVIGSSIDAVISHGSAHHLPYQSAGSPRLIRYSGISGRLALEALRPDGSAFDFVGARRFAPGGLSFLGQEAPVFATGIVVQTSPPAIIRILPWHHAPSQTLRIHVMEAVSG